MTKSCLDLTGRVAVVFGATSGLGKEIAIGLAEHGADVVPAGRRMELLRQVVDRVMALGRRSLLCVADVQNRTSIQRFRDDVLKEFERVDILVNAAGSTFRKSTASVTDQEWNTLFDTNLNGVLHTCQEFHAPLKASGSGRIVSITSLGSFLAFHEVAAYCASKAAVLSLTRSLACEWASDGSCVNAIAPGVFPTELNRHLLTHRTRTRDTHAYAYAPVWECPRTDWRGGSPGVRGRKLHHGPMPRGGWRLSRIGCEFLTCAH